MRFQHQDNSGNIATYKLVFKHGTAVVPSNAEQAPMIRRNLREIMRHIIVTSTKETRGREINLDIPNFEGQEARSIRQPYRMTASFLVNVDKNEIVVPPCTAVCVPPDKFVKAEGRYRSVIMLARQLKEQGYSVDFVNTMFNTYLDNTKDA